MNPASESPKPAADDVKATVDQIARAADAAFKDGVEKTLAAAAEANAQAKKNLEAVAASFGAAAKGAEALGVQAVACSRTAFEAQASAARALAAAKTPQELIELQTGFARTAFETGLAEFGRMSETFAASIKESLEPLNARFAEVAGRLQPTR
jgi:phasin family protein